MKKTNLFIKTLSLILILCSISAFFTACGKEVSVTVTDGKTVTDVIAKSNHTVEKILKDAEIVVSSKDKVEPDLNTKIEDSNTIKISRYAKVTVAFEDEKKTVELFGGTVKDAVKQAGFTLENGLTVNADEDAFLTDGMELTVGKSCSVTLTVDGKTTKYNTLKATVKEFLEEQNVVLGKDDEVSSKLDDKIKNGLKLTVGRVEYKTETRTEPAPYKTQTKNSDSLKKGETEVITKGVDGERKATYKVKYVDGKKTDETLQNEEILKEPVDEVISVGTKEGKTIVSKQPVYDCNGSGHGYYVIKYSDGTTEYEEF